MGPAKGAGSGARGQAWLKDVDPAYAAQLCRVLDDNGTLPAEMVMKLVKADVPPCVPGSCKLNRRDNPSCFCCLAPAPGSFRKKGLWQKEAGLLGSLGTDPTGRARQVGGSTEEGNRRLGERERVGGCAR